MFLQLAENEMTENYTPIETNQGTIYMRSDLLNENGTMLAAQGKGLKIASNIIGKVGPNIPIPGAAKASQIASKVLDKASAIQSKSGIDTSGIGKGIGAKLKGAISKLKKKGAAPEQIAIPEAIVAKTAAEETPPPTFFQKYKTPILIGGGLLIAGTAVYLLTRKKKR